MGLDEEVAVVFLCLRVDTDLELPGVVTVRLVEVRPGEEGRSLHLAVTHVLHSGGKIVVVALVVLVKITM